MKTFKEIFTPQQHGMAFIALARGLSYRDLVAQGVPRRDARVILDLYDTYYGPTRFTRQQALAGNNHHSVEILHKIELGANQLKDAHLGWQLRVELAGVASPAEALRLLEAFLAQHKPVKDVKHGVNITNHANGDRTISLTGSAADIADLETLIDDPEAPVESFVANATGGGTAGFGITTLGVIHLQDLLATCQGQGPDVPVECGNGASVDTAELLRRYCADQGFVAVFTDAGPLQLFREHRLGSYAQRVAATAESTKCCHPQCHKPAEKAQLHHIQDWKDGGLTNSGNLAWLCAYCNSTNGQLGRGRIVRHRGQIAWIPPRGGAPIPVGRKVQPRG
ncbi:HNH endonuclease signature motif containing protein [Corynebacterium phocae]|nr:HNH endonuclease signature motif containing protein [Corynebacterium phocae]